MCLEDVKPSWECIQHLRNLLMTWDITNPPMNEIYKIVKRFSGSFEHKWESLKRDWKCEDRGMLSFLIHTLLLNCNFYFIFFVFLFI
jgi:hypothetical protein